MNKQSDVKFVRVRGRVIPIRKKSGSEKAINAGAKIAIGSYVVNKTAKITEIASAMKANVLAHVAVQKKSKQIADMAVSSAKTSMKASKLRKLTKATGILGLGIYGVGAIGYLKNGKKN